MQIAPSQRPAMALSSSTPSIRRLLPRETSRPSNPAATAPLVASPREHPPGDVLERHQDRPQPGVEGPDRVTGRVGDAGIKRAGGQFAGILERHLGRERQVVAEPDSGERDEAGKPVNSPEQGRGSGGHNRIPCGQRRGLACRSRLVSSHGWVLFAPSGIENGADDGGRAAPDGPLIGIGRQTVFGVREAAGAGRRRRFGCLESWPPSARYWMSRWRCCRAH